MSYELSAGAVIFFKEGDTIEYLMLQYRHLRWDFPRGHVEPGESLRATAEREIAEEIGAMPLRFVPGFEEKVAWSWQRKDLPEVRQKEVVHFLAQSMDKRVVLSEEDLQYRWLSYDDALALPTFPHVKNVLTKVHQFLIQYYAQQ
jgi:bis(5'-nucleosidyl)-tetraphosphatase